MNGMATIRIDKNGVQVVVATGEADADAPRRAALLMPREEFAPSLEYEGNAVIDMLATKIPAVPVGPTTH